MSRIIFILGAGASKEANVPLMADFLDVSFEIRRHSNSGDASPSYDAVFKGIQALQSVFAKSYLDLNNLESVFAAFEMGNLLGRLGDLSPSDIAELPRHTRQLILTTIEVTCHFPNDGQQVFPPTPYQDFVDLIRSLKSKNIPSSVLTFNYDLALDYAFHFNNYHITYGLPKEQDLTGYPYFKLHGSLNWARCTVCDAIIPWKLEQFFSERHWNVFHKPKAVKLDITKLFSQYSHCQKPVSPDPIIVPPTWNKSRYHQLIGDVWKRAATELSDAEDIFICGYSLPETDIFFRQLFAIATATPTRLRRFWVFDPDQYDTVKPRFESLVGAGAKNRFSFNKLDFKSAISIILKTLMNDSD